MARVAILTTSDGVANGIREDASGDALADLLAQSGFELVARDVVPDDRDVIAAGLRRLADDVGADLVVVTGGTGFGPRDVTPEATDDVIDRRAPGLAEAMRAAGRASTPMADLSRATAGVRGTTLILDLPGSPRGATESLQAVLPVLPHAIDLLGGATADHPAGHGDDHAAAGSDDRSGHDHAHGHDHGHDPGHDAACDLAHGHGDIPSVGTLVAISASPVALALLHWAGDLGYDTVLVENDPARVSDGHRAHADRIVTAVADAGIHDRCDVVATDHDIDDLVDHLAAALRTDARWIGLMGSRRATPPHVDGLRDRGFSDDEIARIARPIGLDLGSRTPPEIALATLAGLLADRNGRLVEITRP